MDENKTTYNLEAEESVIGSIIVDNKKTAKIRELINHDDFYGKDNRIIFKAIEALNDRGSVIDILTLSDTLTKNGFLDVVGGYQKLLGITSTVVTSTRALAHAKIVADASAKRRITKAAHDIVQASSSGSTLEETLETVQRKIDEVNKIGGKQNKYQVASMLDYIDDSKERYKNWGKMQGWSSGFPSIDDLTLGLVDGELIIVAGPTSRGKTLLSMHIANNIAKSGGRVLFVTLEMTKTELTSRYMYANNGWDTDDFSLVAANTLFQDNDELDWKDIDGLIANAKQELDVDLVVIDHLHYFARDIKNAAEELGKITMTFKKNAIRHSLPIILISHIRKMQKDEDLSGDVLRGSSLIAQDSDIVLLVNRDPETNQMGILIDKNRNRGKLSDRTKDWAGRSERELNTIYLDFNNTKLHDPKDILGQVKAIFPDSVESKAYKD